jgi:hypothetical protein
MQQQNGIQRPFFTAAMFKSALVGAAIALTLIIIFLAGAGEPNPAWPKLWRIRPLIIVPLAGACGGAFFSFITNLRIHNGWVLLAARILGIIVFIIGLWLGTVLGLDGTYWD